MKEQEETVLPKIGYLYHYPRLDHASENFRLDIFVASIPTELHFDVQHAHFFVKTPENAIERLTISHPWTYKKDEQVCAGVVIMEDRNKVKKEAFTFGGNLKIATEETHTTCVLTSTAPILDIIDAMPVQRFFVEELEIILAERRAVYADHHDYETYLGAADPRELYLASLEALLQKFENFPSMDKNQREFLSFLRAEKKRLYAVGISAEAARSLKEIFPASEK